MAFALSPSNVDYLIPDIRVRIGDIDKTAFSDKIVRTALISGIKFLQNKWQRRYQVYADTMLINPQPTNGTTPAGYIYAALPDGYNYIPSGLNVNDVFRNPTITFADVSTSIIVQEDEYPITLAAVLFLRENLLSSNQQTFVNWSDGEYSYSNVAASNVMRGLSASTLDELNAYFKIRRGAPKRGDFTNYLV